MLPFCAQFWENTLGAFHIAMSFSESFFKAAHYFMQARVYNVFCSYKVRTWLPEISHDCQPFPSHSENYL